MSYFQRLTADDRCGFNYDYMGAAEFGFGSTTKARTEIARAWKDGTISARRIEFEGIEVIAIGPVAVVDALPERIAGWFKENPRINEPKILAWMGVYASPPVILLREAEQTKALEAFLRPAVDFLREEEAAGTDVQ